MVLSVVLYKQKTAYELRMSDWSSDVCSSDLSAWPATFPWPARRWRRRRWRGCAWPQVGQARMAKPREDPALDDLRTRRWPYLEECGAAPGALSSRSGGRHPTPCRPRGGPQQPARPCRRAGYRASGDLAAPTLESRRPASPAPPPESFVQGT